MSHKRLNRPLAASFLLNDARLKNRRSPPANAGPRRGRHRRVGPHGAERLGDPLPGRVIVEGGQIAELGAARCGPMRRAAAAASLRLMTAISSGARSRQPQSPASCADNRLPASGSR